jgi:hypothetical protein
VSKDAIAETCRKRTCSRYESLHEMLMCAFDGLGTKTWFRTARVVWSRRTLLKDVASEANNAEFDLLFCSPFDMLIRRIVSVIMKLGPQTAGKLGPQQK